MFVKKVKLKLSKSANSMIRSGLCTVLLSSLLIILAHCLFMGITDNIDWSENYHLAAGIIVTNMPLITMLAVLITALNTLIFYMLFSRSKKFFAFALSGMMVVGQVVFLLYAMTSVSSVS